MTIFQWAMAWADWFGVDYTPDIFYYYDWRGTTLPTGFAGC